VFCKQVKQLGASEKGKHWPLLPRLFRVGIAIQLNITYTGKQLFEQVVKSLLDFVKHGNFDCILLAG